MSAYYQPETLDDALALLGRTRATIAAGCTDLFPATDRPFLTGDVLDITAVAGLRGIGSGPDGWRIGATTTWSDILAADLPPAFDMLGQAARQVGSVQIQNAGTVAGNLCNASPAADGVPPLLALGAEVELTSASGQRRMALAEFLTGVRETRRAPGELLTALVIPQAATQGQSVFLKLGARAYLVISMVMVAARLVIRDDRVDDIAIAVGACSPVARRLSALEQHLTGRPVSDLAAAVDPDLVGTEIAPISDIRADADYRRHAAAEMIRRALAGLGTAR